MKIQQFDAIVSRVGIEAQIREISFAQDTGAKASRKGKCPFTLEPFADCHIRNKNYGGKACPYSLEACLNQSLSPRYY